MEHHRMIQELESLRPFDALVFDCDGTLADTVPVHEAAWVEAFGEQGLDMSSDWYRRHLSLSAEGLVETRCAGHRVSREAIYRTRERSYLENLAGVAELPAARVARTFAGTVPLAVASSGDRSLVVATLEALSMTDVFDVIVTVVDVENSKPAPDLYERAAACLAVPGGACVAFEDSPGGVAAAVSAGMKVIDVRGYA